MSIVPDEAVDLMLDLFSACPRCGSRIFSRMSARPRDTLTPLGTGAPCSVTIRILNVFFVEGLNLGLSKIAVATCSHEFL